MHFNFVIKTPLFIFVAFIFFELSVRAPHYLFGREAHQRFSFSGQTPEHSPKVNNSRGAVGWLTENRPVKIAIFGNSTTLAIHEPMQSWAMHLQKLEPTRWQVDNYSGAWNTPGDIYEDLVSLETRNLKYDIVIFQGDFTISQRPDSKRYSARRRFQKQPGLKLLTPVALAKWWQRKLSQGSSQWLPFAHAGQNENTITAELRQLSVGDEAVVNKRLRQSQQFDEFLVEQYEPIKVGRQKKAEGNIQLVFDQAKRISKHQVWLPFKTGYSQHMLSSYLKNYEMLRPTKALDRTGFLSPRSLYDRLDERNAAAESAIRKFYPDTAVLDYYDLLESLMHSEEGLYVDEMHHSPLGHKTIARFLYPELQKILLQ